MIFLKTLWNYIALSAPYLLIGLFFAGLVKQFLGQKFIEKHMGGKGLLPILKASLIGVPLPLCSCSVIPTAVTLKKSGAKNGPTSAFLISTPETGIDSLSLTYALIDLPMTLIRPLAAFVSASLAGVLQVIFKTDLPLQSPQENPHSCCSKKHHQQQNPSFWNKLKQAFIYGFGDLITDIAPWLSFGLVVGSLINFLVPDQFFMQLSTHQAKFMILLIGIPLYICASATTPIAASLMIKGISPGTALILLMVGPATNISNLAILQKYLGKQAVLLNILAIAFSSLIFSYLTDYLYSHFIQLEISPLLAHHQHGPSLINHISAAILSLLILKGFLPKNIKEWIK